MKKKNKKNQHLSHKMLEITSLRTWILKFSRGVCPTVFRGWSAFGEHLSEPSLNLGLPSNIQTVCSFLCLNLCNSWKWLSGHCDNILILSLGTGTIRYNFGEGSFISKASVPKIYRVFFSIFFFNINYWRRCVSWDRYAKNNRRCSAA